MEFYEIMFPSHGPQSHSPNHIASIFSPGLAPKPPFASWRPSQWRCFRCFRCLLARRIAGALAMIFRYFRGHIAMISKYDLGILVPVFFTNMTSMLHEFVVFLSESLYIRSHWDIIFSNLIGGHYNHGFRMFTLW